MRFDPILFIVALQLSLGIPSISAGDPGVDPIDRRQMDQLISFEANPEIFPESWRKAPYHMSARSIAEDQEARAKKLVGQAVRKYPANLIERSLERIYLVGELQVYREQNFSGTAHTDAVYLVVKSEREGFSDPFVRRTFHREFSTTLLNRHLDRFDADAWKQVNGASFSYTGHSSWQEQKDDREEGGKQAISSGEVSLELVTDQTMLRRGFLTEYSRSSLENDFNEYGARLFTGSPGFWKRAGSYQGVRKKCDLAMAFYRRVHPDLTPAYFRNLARK